MDVHLLLWVVLPLALVVALITWVALCDRELRWPRSVARNDRAVRRVSALVAAVDVQLGRWHARIGPWRGSVLLALVLTLVAFVYVNGDVRMWSHGAIYAALSEAPFDPVVEVPLRNRILAPLIGWLLHLRGPLFVLVPWAFLVGFLAIVHQWCLRAGAFPVLALAGLLSLSFSPVVLHVLVAPGFVDVVAYFMIATALSTIHRPWTSTLFMALAIMTHEASSFVVLAWSLASASRSSGWRSVGRRGLMLLVCLLPYAAYRWWTAQHDPSLYSMAFYLSKENIAACLGVGPLAMMAGIFAVFRMHWVVLAVLMVKGGMRDQRLRWAMTLIAAMCFSLVLAYDTTRMFCWAYPILVVGVVSLGERVGQKKAALLILLAWLLNFVIPPYTTTAAVSYPLRHIKEFMEMPS